MKTVAFGSTDAGRIRPNNEDSLLVDDIHGLYIVCDGVGGSAAGEIASRFATRTVGQYIERNLSRLTHPDISGSQTSSPEELLREAVHEVQRGLFALARMMPELNGLATTMTLVLVWQGNAIVAHIGDSRLYRLRNNKIECLTDDHTMAADLRRRGIAIRETRYNGVLSNTLSRCINNRNEAFADILVTDFLTGDTLLLCTDGLHKYFELDEFGALLSQTDASTLPDQLIALANTRGGDDNITVVILRAGDQITTKTTAVASCKLSLGQVNPLATC